MSQFATSEDRPGILIFTNVMMYAAKIATHYSFMICSSDFAQNKELYGWFCH